MNMVDGVRYVGNTSKESDSRYPAADKQES
jgi:hypothetical protein